jgi:hypothetical protein
VTTVLGRALPGQAGPRWRQFIRAGGWVGGVFLLLYGIALAAVATAVLAGVVTPPGVVDRIGLTGHALLWDLLFAAWGALLLAGLWRTREVPARHRADDGSPVPKVHSLP